MQTLHCAGDGVSERVFVLSSWERDSKMSKVLHQLVVNSKRCRNMNENGGNAGLAKPAGQTETKIHVLTEGFVGFGYGLKLKNAKNMHACTWFSFLLYV